MSGYLEGLDFSCVVDDRPDFRGDRKWGITEAKKFHPFVYSANKNGALVHKTRRVMYHWWAGVNHQMVRRKRPLIIAETMCAQSFFLESGRAVVCKVPAPGAVLCGRCHGTGSTFRKTGDWAARQAARARLGCMPEGVST